MPGENQGLSSSDYPLEIEGQIAVNPPMDIVIYFDKIIQELNIFVNIILSLFYSAITIYKRIGKAGRRESQITLTN